MKGTRHEFTLVELLVIVAIVTILSAMLLPALTKSREQAVAEGDRPGIEQAALALGLYQGSGAGYEPDCGGGDVVHAARSTAANNRVARELAMARLQREIADEGR